MLLDSREAILVTRSFRSAKGYDPRARILDGSKRHTLRRHRWKPGIYEAYIDGKRSGILIRVRGAAPMKRAQYLTREFALADGFRGEDPEQLLEDLLSDLYGIPPSPMVANYFEVVAIDDVYQAHRIKETKPYANEECGSDAQPL